MENIILKYKNFEVIENNALFELRKNGVMIVDSIVNSNSLFKTIQDEEVKDQKRLLIKEHLNDLEEKEQIIHMMNQIETLNIREINYEELINNRFGFTQKGYLINEGDIRRLLTKDEFVDILLSYYHDLQPLLEKKLTL